MKSPFVVKSLVWCILLAMTPMVAPGAGPSGRSSLPEPFTADRLLWEMELATHQYTVPRIDAGQIFLGVNDLEIDHPAVRSSGGGILMCREAATGKLIWQLPIPRNFAGSDPPSHFGFWKCGVCSQPAIDGDRLFIVGPRGDVLCIDRNGQADGNDGPFLDDARYMGVPKGSDYRLTKTDGDVVWRFDMVEELGVFPHDVCGSSPTQYGDCVYFCTSNGQGHLHRTIVNPNAPSLIAIEKTTGRLLAVDDEPISANTLHGQWSSPVAAVFDDRPMIIYGGGDGVLYAFAPVAASKVAASKVGDTPGKLATLWKRDCCPADYRTRDGRPLPYSGWRKKLPNGPSEIISTPTIHNGRIYVAIGQSPIHGPGDGMLSCIDGATGEVVWQNRDVDRTLSTAAIHDGLVYLPDYSGNLNCIDAETGKTVWQHEVGPVWCASATVADGRVFVGTERNTFWVLKAGRQKEVLGKDRVRSMPITMAVGEGAVYLPTQKRIFAVEIGE